MTIDEANKIFKTWGQWYWPCHFILHAIFLSKIPESFLPYATDILEEALNIVAKQYYDNGDLKTYRDIQGSIASLIAYTNDEEALQQASESLSNSKMREVMLTYIRNYQKDWTSWLKEQSPKTG